MMGKEKNIKAASGFTLIELLVVIAIIGFLAAVTLGSLTEARLSARYTKARVDIRNIARLAEFAKGTRNSTLANLTGSICSECACRNSGTALPVTVSLHDLPDTHACHLAYQNVVQVLNANTGDLLKITAPPLDPWGAPYLINENEGEVLPGGNCATDNITSAGPNGLYYDTDDVTYNTESTLCPNPISHHPNTNWN